MRTPVTPPTTFRGTFRTDDDARAVYSEAAGIGRTLPIGVAVPADPDDLATLVRWAASEKVPLVPRGSGSSMPGGAIGDGLIVDLSRWRKVGAVDVAGKTIRVGPGITRGEVDRIARAQGLRFPPDPSSGAFCSVGGMASTNAAGAHSMHFGMTRRWVRAIDCVFSDGSRAEIRRGEPIPRGIPALDRLQAIAPELIASERKDPSRHHGVIKDASGYGVADFADSNELVDLLIGSEGTLAFFVELELMLTPVADATSSVLGAFARLEDAVVAASRARAGGAVACEMLERTFLDVAASGGAPRQVPAESEAALLAEVEGVDAEAASKAAKAVEEVFRTAGATTTQIALDEHTETELWELRHAASPILSKLDVNLKSMQFIEDCAVPPENLPAYVRGIREILGRHDTRVVIFGHAGDCHIHVNPLVDVRRPDWRATVESILTEVVALASRLGGTLSGEHGDGRLRAPLLHEVWSAEALAQFRRVKDAFDPDGILNPGAKLAVAGERAIAGVKYDPSAPTLPPRARAALDRVERARDYARFRLDLLDDSASS
ncbi:MAG TPA: FAD-binding oxidoreductase [Gemmatimonadaceae bacterium]|jgi:FAD/FMN-containing dehydrogenase